jgi:hypothetical protein
MRVQRGDGVRCGFISRGVVVYGILCRFGTWGGLGYLWLGTKDGGEDKREPGKVSCLGRSCCWLLNKFETRFLHTCMSITNGYLQALEDKRESAATVGFRPEGCQVLEKAGWWFGEVSLKFGKWRWKWCWMHALIN